MSCPTCTHTMSGLGNLWFWCPRCGTVKQANCNIEIVDMPKGANTVRNWLMKPAKADVTQTLKEQFLSPEER